MATKKNIDPVLVIILEAITKIILTKSNDIPVLKKAIVKKGEMIDYKGTWNNLLTLTK